MNPFYLANISFDQEDGSPSKEKIPSSSSKETDLVIGRFACADLCGISLKRTAQ